MGEELGATFALASAVIPKTVVMFMDSYIGKALNSPAGEGSSAPEEVPEEVPAAVEEQVEPPPAAPAEGEDGAEKQLTKVRTQPHFQQHAIHRRDAKNPILCHAGTTVGPGLSGPNSNASLGKPALNA